MILDFPGGARPLERTHFGKSKTVIIKSCSAICIKASADAKILISAGARVLRGSPIGENGGTPVYSSIAGVFRGILELEGETYFVVMSDGSEGEEKLHLPETRALTDMSLGQIIESAKNLAIIDSRSGVPLWKLLRLAGENCRRLVVDCTEPDASSAINYRLCIEHAKELVYGSKILLHATGALKCVFAAEHYRNAAFDAISEYATDEKLFALARLEEKYPYGDRAIMQALYVKTLEKDKTALDEGVFIVAPETVIALYNAMRSGIPQLDRYIAVCGEGVAKGGNLRVPRGITLHDITKLCCGIAKGCFLVENSLLSGVPASGALSDGTRALIGAKKQKKKRLSCISCGRCAEVCPVRLLPNEILSGGSNELFEACVACGACEFICPSGIPLLGMIKKNRSKEAL